MHTPSNNNTINYLPREIRVRSTVLVYAIYNIMLYKILLYIIVTSRRRRTVIIRRLYYYIL